MGFLLKYRAFVVFMLMIFCSCEKVTSDQQPDQISKSSKRGSEYWMRTDRTQGTRYNPVPSKFKKVALKDLDKNIKANVNGILISHIKVRIFALSHGVKLNIPPPDRDVKLHGTSISMVMDLLVDEALESGQLVVEAKDFKLEQEKFMRELKGMNISLKTYFKQHKTSQIELDRKLNIQAFISSLITEKMKRSQYKKIKANLEQTRRFKIIYDNGIQSEATIKQGDNRVPSRLYDAVFALKKVGDISQIISLPKHMREGNFRVQLSEITRPAFKEKEEEIIRTLSDDLRNIFIQVLEKYNSVTLRPKDRFPKEFIGEEDDPNAIVPRRNK